jgi:hypothetical protein
MLNKTYLKFGAAFVILAIVLIFLGVNFVPRIFASSSPQKNAVDSVSIARSNYSNELYPRSISSQLSLAGSDWIERHPVVATQSSYLAGSDWIERHPSTYLTKSDWSERHPK